MDSTHDVVANDLAVNHKCATVHASPIQNAVTLAVWPSDHDEIHVLDERTNHASRFDLVPGSYDRCAHSASCEDATSRPSM